MNSTSTICSSGSPIFQASSLGGRMLMWVDGDTWTAGSWTDLSGAGHSPTAVGIAQGTRVTDAINRHSVIRLNGTANYYRAAFTLAQPYTVFAVYRSVAIGGGSLNDTIWGGANDFNGGFYSDSTPQAYGYAGTLRVLPGALANNTFVQLTVGYAGASSFVRVNRVQVDSGNIGSAAAAGISIGATLNAGTPARFSQTDYASIMIVQGISDVKRVERALYRRFRV